MHQAHNRECIIITHDTVLYLLLHPSDLGSGDVSTRPLNFWGVFDRPCIDYDHRKASHPSSDAVLARHA